MTEERFEELLGGVLEEWVGAEPRAGLEGRVLARLGDGLPARQRRWAWAVVFGGTLVLGVSVGRTVVWQKQGMAGAATGSAAAETSARQPDNAVVRRAAAEGGKTEAARTEPSRARERRLEPAKTERLQLAPLAEARLRVEPLALEGLRVPALGDADEGAGGAQAGEEW